MKNYRSKQAVWALLALLLLGSLFGKNVKAQERYRVPDLDANRQASLMVNLYYLDPALPANQQIVKMIDQPLELAKVADLKVGGGSASYISLPEYEAYQIEYDKLSTVSASNQAAATLAAAAAKGATLSQRTNRDGQAVFSKMDAGMYVLFQHENANQAYQVDEIAPMLISLPSVLQVDGTNIWNYEVELNPKTALIAERDETEVTPSPPAANPNETPSDPSRPQGSPSRPPENVNRPQGSGQSSGHSYKATFVNTGDRDELWLLGGSLLAASLILILVWRRTRAKSER